MNKMDPSQCTSVFVRRLFGIIFIFILSVGPAVGQGQRQRQRLSPEQQQERFETRTQETMIALELSDDQKLQFLEIMEAANADRDDLLEDMRAGGDRSGIREKMAKLNEGTDAALSAVLTDEQMEEYKEIQSQGRRRRGRTQS